jgi:hypothetical protein
VATVSTPVEPDADEVEPELLPLLLPPQAASMPTAATMALAAIARTRQGFEDMTIPSSPIGRDSQA